MVHFTLITIKLHCLRFESEPVNSNIVNSEVNIDMKVLSVYIPVLV